MSDLKLNHYIFGPEGVSSIFKSVRQLVHDYRTKRKLYLSKRRDITENLENAARESISRIKERYDQFYARYGEAFAQGDRK
jgi:hypothetical protein